MFRVSNFFCIKPPFPGLFTFFLRILACSLEFDFFCIKPPFPGVFTFFPRILACSMEFDSYSTSWIFPSYILNMSFFTTDYNSVLFLPIVIKKNPVIRLFLPLYLVYLIKTTGVRLCITRPISLL